MSSARPVGMRAEVQASPPCGSRPSWVAGIGDADALRDIVRDDVIEHLADDAAVLVIDETGFLKHRGKASCGVARQYTCSAADQTNRQIGVFAAYVSRHGHAFIDRALYLPKQWTDDRDRLEAAYVPRRCRLALQPKLATRMIARAIAASVPFKWVAGDTVYGIGDIEQQRRRAGKGYVLGVSSAHVFQSRGSGRRLPARAGRISPWTRGWSDWKRLSAGAGTGQRTAAGMIVSSQPADLEGEQRDYADDGLRTRGLLIRRRIADGDLAFFTTRAPAGTSIQTLVAIEGHRWAIEDSFETAKNASSGLDHNEEQVMAWLASSTRSGDARLRHDGRHPTSRNPPARNRPPPGKNKNTTTPSLIRWSIQVAGSPSTLLESASTRPHHRSAVSGEGRIRPSRNARPSEQNGNCKTSTSAHRFS